MKIDKEVLERIKKAETAFALTGAGSSAPSGIPTFRGSEGFWKDKTPFSVEMFKENPQIVWEWHIEIKNLIKKAKPNASHFTLAKMQKFFKDFAVITQNIDNLHQEAGSDKVIELHGNIYRNKCNDCGKKYGEIDTKEIPKCEECGGLVRPDVVWFGEPLPYDALLEARRYAERSELCFVIGTSGVVQPAASIPLIAKEYGAFVVEVNIEETVLSRYLDYSIFGDVSIVLPELYEELLKNGG
ncbi:MAG: NAD-dependent deacylase [candidate division WOR-3 bacterium]